MKKVFLDVIKREKYRRIVAAVVFLLIVIKVFVSATYLFRNNGCDRFHVVGIKDENTMDMVYIGGSAAFVYWEPLKAWNDCGFTSYNLATNSLQAESIEYYIKQALRYHEPELFIIDARPFQYYMEDGIEMGLRHSSDSMDFFSIDRIRLVYEYLNHHNMGDNIDELSFYLDIIKYHLNYSALASPKNWGLIHNKGITPNKGFEWIYEYEYLDYPENYKTDKCSELMEENVEILYSLLNYCQENKLNVLFVVCPYQINEEHQEKYNTIEDIVTSCGFDFLNTNEYYTEMGIEFSTDFYNVNHVNCYGAEKYTDFLEKYIVEHYNLPDHRGELEYTDWDKDFERFSLEEQATKNAIDALIQEAQEP